VRTWEPSISRTIPNKPFLFAQQTIQEETDIILG